MPPEENAHMGETVACIGMGLLGSALAENLIRAGFTVRGYDIAPERMREHAARGGVAADSPADAARGAGTVVTCLMTADIVREALLGPQGALDAAGPGSIVVDCSTIHPDASAALAAELARRGIAMLDAPVAGSSGQARRREAPVVVGGDRLVFERCRPPSPGAHTTWAATARGPGPSSWSTWCSASTGSRSRRDCCSGSARASMDPTCSRC